MRRPFIAANWKMNKSTSETQEFIERFSPAVKGVSDVDIVLAPPFTSLTTASEVLKSLADTHIMLAAQDIFYEEKGAYTGEISPLMLIDAGCKCVIIGHSERRQYFYETDEIVNRKIKAAQKAGLGTIVCIGEFLEEREKGKTFDVLEREINKGLDGIDIENVVIAYEPIWAIGTGRTATPEQAQEVHAFIRERLRKKYDNKSDDVRIIYGGSVTPENVDSLMACTDVDGALVGGASLKVENFVRIVKFNK
jgi:triosephosphate isomerase